MIEITSKAVEMIKYYRSNSSHPDSKFFRIKIVGGGCSGLRYELVFDDDIDDEEDFIEEAYGEKIIIDEKSALYVTGSQLDYVDTLMESGFKIINPNAQNTCGCGESFGV